MKYEFDLYIHLTNGVVRKFETDMEYRKNFEKSISENSVGFIRMVDFYFNLSHLVYFEFVSKNPSDNHMAPDSHILQ